MDRDCLILKPAQTKAELRNGEKTRDRAPLNIPDDIGGFFVIVLVVVWPRHVAGGISVTRPGIEPGPQQ